MGKTVNDYQSYGSFKPILTLDVDGKFPVVVYESEKTKLKVAVAQVDGPIVNGYITLATEARDDDGLPHTLEHLVFMGSEDYPYKGVLDILANRCLASGTNAWTEIDHTCYTVTTAGSEGFSNILPIFLDHVMYPTLTEEAYITEIHHVNGEGEDAGIVYSEMQSVENSATEVVHFAMQQALYPQNCGYRYNYGGLMKNLRESTDNAKVRNYHKEFYRSENIWIIVTGQVEPLKILKSIEPIEEKTVKKGLNPSPHVRPWMEPIEPLTESVEKDVTYPADEEDNGVVLIGWRGPSSITEQKKLSVLSVLLDYLTDTPVSPLQKAFVEIESPLASTVSSSITENAVSAICVKFSDVPVAKLSVIHEQLRTVLRDVNDKTIDVDRVRTILRKKVLDAWGSLESDPHGAISYDLIGHMLYGNTAEDLTYRLNEDKYFTELMKMDVDFWAKAMKEFFDESKPWVVIRAKPSIEMKHRLAKEERERVEARVKELGRGGLINKQAVVDHAISANDEEPEDDLLDSVPVPSTDGIPFHPIKLYSNFALPAGDGKTVIDFNAPNFDLKAMPIRMRVDDVNTKFVHMHLTIDTSAMDPGARTYLPLYLEAITECPLRYPPGIRWCGKDSPDIKVDADGYQIVPYELVVSQIEADTQALSAYLGVGGGGVFYAGYFSNYAVFYCQVEASKYAEGIRWLRDLLYFPHFDPVRIQVIASKLAQSVAQKKKKGGKIVKALITDMDFVTGSNHRSISMIRQQHFLNEASRDLLKLLDSKGDLAGGAEPPVMKNLKKLYKYFTEHTSGLMLHMAADLRLLSEKNAGVPLEKPWLETLLPDIEHFAVVVNAVDFNSVPPVVTDAALVANMTVRMAAGTDHAMIPVMHVDARHGCLVGMGSADASYLLQTTQTDVKSYNHPDCPALMLFIEYLQQSDGPLHKAVRGSGLAYHYYLRLSPEEGLITLCLGMASQLVDAYRETKKVLVEHLTKDFELDEDLFESAKGSLIFGIIEKEQSITDLVDQSLLASFRGLPADFSRKLIDRIWNMEPEEMVEVGVKHLVPLLEPLLSRCAVVCHSDKLKDIEEGFWEFRWRLCAFDSVDKCILSNLC
jgi:Zn-dependent M16 (insulinase) family peptidase